MAERHRHVINTSAFCLKGREFKSLLGDSLKFSVVFVISFGEADYRETNYSRMPKHHSTLYNLCS
jgi:hypothetical protein